eukprot:TRINITY_DN4670_c0_g2_i1.p1 TRINITY_DN4670_c0_g2~~TRINITY_DN4670_c0_g2_i1.p1  ORF type:complete len:1291 (-),score=214.94 TRINITY_DN4670_c0_g2_i1:58-3930(-)
MTGSSSASASSSSPASEQQQKLPELLTSTDRRRRMSLTYASKFAVVPEPGGGQAALVVQHLDRANAPASGASGGIATRLKKSMGRFFKLPYRAAKPTSALTLMRHTHKISSCEVIEEAVRDDTLVVFGSTDESGTQMVMHALKNILVDESNLVFHDISSKDMQGLMKHRDLIELTGQSEPPYVFVAQESMGSAYLVIRMIQSGAFAALLKNNGINAKADIGEVSITNNIFNYPKGDLGGLQKWGREGCSGISRLNVLVVACGSTASDKIPKLVGMLKEEGLGVKLATTRSGEHFFKDHGMAELHKHLSISDIYRDDDEWAFRYQEFGMPVRALHLALCDWADIAVVAPVSCNTMGKIANGCADSLATCIFVAWQYQQKPVIFAPACNANMWNNISTRNSVSVLKEMGVTFVGPVEGKLSSGRTGLGTMAPLTEILESVRMATKALENPIRWVLNIARTAAKDKDLDMWPTVLRFIDEETVDINDTDPSHFGDSVLHIALGGDLGEHDCAEAKTANINVDVVSKLIKCKADVNLKNQFNISPLDVAVSNKHIQSCSLLLDSKADPTKQFKLLETTRDASTEEFRLLLQSHLNRRPLRKNKISALGEDSDDCEEDVGEYFFVWDDLKENFPKHDKTVLSKLVGLGISSQAFPLIVPTRARCDDPNCAIVHQHPALLDKPGMGYNIKGEVHELKPDTFKHLDVYFGYYGTGNPANMHVRRLIPVRIQGGKEVHAHCYFDTAADNKMNELQDGTAECREEYTIQMAQGNPKPGYTSLASLANLKPSIKKQRMSSFGAFEVQQAINCCNITALEYGFNMLGADVSVNDIFHAAEVPVGWVVNAGLCLSQLTTVATEVAAKIGGLWVEAYHFDEDRVTYSDFEAAMLSYVSRPPGDEVVIVNFSVKIAHNKPSGGGHFALLGYLEQDASGEWLAVVYEVHPKKYGRMWSCPLPCLFKAMQDRDMDMDVRRSRGIIRLGRHSDRDAAGDGWARLYKANTYVCYCDMAFDEETRMWLEKFGSFPVRCFESATNMGGMACAALVISALTGVTTFPDAIVRKLNLDYTVILNQVLESNHLIAVINDYMKLCKDELDEKNIDPVKASPLRLGEDCEEFLNTLAYTIDDVQGGSNRSAVLVRLDFNLAHAARIVRREHQSVAGGLHHGTAHWTIIVDVDPDVKTVTFADPKSKMAQRLWKAPASDVWLSMQAMETTMGVKVKVKTSSTGVSMRRSSVSIASVEEGPSVEALRAKTRSQALFKASVNTLMAAAKPNRTPGILPPRSSQLHELQLEFNKTESLR